MGVEKIGFIDPSTFAKKPERKKENKAMIGLKEMHTKAEAVEKNNKINPEEFVKIYGDSVYDDMEKAQLRKEKFSSRMDASARECKQYAEVMEAILVDLVNSAEWLGEETKAMNTADYDDLENGVDVIAEMSKDGYKKHLGLAMDATFSNEVSDKFRSVKGEIKRGELSEIKYFKSGNFKGALSQVPHLVIGVSLGKIKELGAMWVRGEHDKLRNHPVQYQILEEMIMQLEAYQRYAVKCNQTELAEIYSDSLKTLLHIKAEKEKVLLDSGERDHVFKNIKKEVEEFNNI